MNTHSISPLALYARLGTVAAPLVIDVRRPPAFDADSSMLAGAVRRLPDQVGEWSAKISQSRPVVVYCVHGHEVSQDAAAALCASGVDARYLEGGIASWISAALPTRNKSRPAERWITRERPKIDRIACPWLVRRFVNPEATFAYAPAASVLETAHRTGAIAYDISGAEPFSHDGERCTFDAVMKVFGIDDPPLARLALIVRGADTGNLELTPQSAGLLAVSLGLSANHANDDHAMLEAGMVLYDALYAWCRSAHAESHRWNPS